MRTELITLRSELSALKPKLETLSAYSDEGRRVRARVEYLERRIRELELEKIRNEGQASLF